MTVFSAKNYKLAKIYIKDLDVIIIETEKALRALKPYSHYKSVKRIVNHLQEELTVQKTHLQNCGIIVQSKGKVVLDEENGK